VGRGDFGRGGIRRTGGFLDPRGLLSLAEAEFARPEKTIGRSKGSSMNRSGLTVVALLAWFANDSETTLAQETQPQKKTPRAVADAGLLNSEIDDLLQKWNKKTIGVHTLYTEFTRTVVESAFRNKRVNTGVARFVEPNLARLDIRENEKKEGREIFLLAEQPNLRGGKGLEIRHYIVGQRILDIREFPDKATPNAQEEGPLRLLFGVKPESAHARYAFEILKKTTKSISIRIVPRLEPDRQEFLEAVVTLDTESFMPLELRVKENADTDVTYAFESIHTNINTPDLQLPKSDFDAPPIKKEDWKINRQKIVVENDRPMSGRKTVRN
jgi:TIGR03009 family protein